MGLKARVERLRKRLRPERGEVSLRWYDPETGKVSYTITLTPRGRHDFSCTEQWFDEEEQKPEPERGRPR